eukprot:CAMPEP_0197526454 /NCGR_PEP_ID=MMETSP1318-20131121/17841_1 /TAXON_ID=552666 /ORGANISM="Partenskyella glossopodia, Strain RCC365" /LENGTH=454 /DNA_ID=CAMNT_0043080617 /DNA_START=82 /DNA_END=1444 /DNA_ORIENTATION=-
MTSESTVTGKHLHVAPLEFGFGNPSVQAFEAKAMVFRVGGGLKLSNIVSVIKEGVCTAAEPEHESKVAWHKHAHDHDTKSSSSTQVRESKSPSPTHHQNHKQHDHHDRRDVKSSTNTTTKNTKNTNTNTSIRSRSSSVCVLQNVPIHFSIARLHTWLRDALPHIAQTQVISLPAAAAAALPSSHSSSSSSSFSSHSLSSSSQLTDCESYGLMIQFVQPKYASRFVDKYDGKRFSEMERHTAKAAVVESLEVLGVLTPDQKKTNKTQQTKQTKQTKQRSRFSKQANSNKAKTTTNSNTTEKFRSLSRLLESSLLHAAEGRRRSVKGGSSPSESEAARGEREQMSGKEGEQSTSASSKCPVCLEAIGMTDTSGAGILSLCLHHFHFDCLAKWAEASCPVCRASTQPSPPSASLRAEQSTTSGCVWCAALSPVARTARLTSKPQTTPSQPDLAGREE